MTGYCKNKKIVIINIQNYPRFSGSKFISQAKYKFCDSVLGSYPYYFKDSNDSYLDIFF